MSVLILSMEKIKPSTPTPHHRKNYKLSLLDQFTPSSYIPLIFFYPNKFVSNTYTSNTTFAARILFPTTQLKESLSKVLTIYYPLAGRLKKGAASSSVECNDEGVEFIEARATGSLSEFLNRPDLGSLNNFLPCNAWVLEKGSNITPAKVKITIFDVCGGIVIGICVFHKICDATTLASFVKTWAKVSRKEKVDELRPNFTFVSDVLPAREISDLVTSSNNMFFQCSRQSQPMIIRRYVFYPTVIRKLKKKVASDKVPNPTRVEALTAFVVKHMNAAEEAATANSSSSSSSSSLSKTLMITHAVNLRRHIEPPPPDNTPLFGNIIFSAIAVHECSDHRYKSTDLVETLNDSLVSFKNERILDLLEVDRDAFTRKLMELIGILCNNENIKVYSFTSWCNMGVYDVNFGWGNPIWVAPIGNIINMADVYIPMQQYFMFIESEHQGKGIELWLYANEQKVCFLENDPEFLAYATPNPSICVD